MTTEHMWQAVAEKIEPFASLPKPQDECWSGIPSPLRLWVNISEYGEGDISKWELRAYDAEMCLMLLKRLPWPEITRFKDLDNEGWLIVTHWDRPADSFVAVELEAAILGAAYQELCSKSA